MAKSYEIRGCRTRALLAAAFVLAFVSPAHVTAQSHFPGDESVRAIVRRAATLPPGVSVVVGLLERDGKRRVLAVGDTTLDGRTLFEIGSITKVFTGILLAYAVESGEARLDQPVAELLPDSVRVPTREGKQITLLNLATHTSGLPRMPNNMRPADWSNPYADYTIEQLYAFLEGHTIERDIGDEPVYSNYGAALLGHTLARREGMTWLELTRARILEPLGMRNTMTAIPDSARPRLVKGHNRSGNPVPNWDLAEVFAGAGALRSGADDMLTFLAAHISAPESTTLGRAMRRAATRHPVGFANGGLHWGINQNRFGNTTIGHGGGTAGYTTYIGYDPVRRIGVVVLNNASGIANPQRLAQHLLDQRTPLSSAGLARGFRILAMALTALFVAGIAVAWRRSGASWRRVTFVALAAAIGSAAWLSLTSTAARRGLLNEIDPPVFMMTMAVTMAIVLTLGLTRVGGRLAAALPLWLLVGFHAFRLPLELLMHRAYEHGLMPREMSYTGWNFDILTGIAALVLAIMLARGAGRRPCGALVQRPGRAAPDQYRCHLGAGHAGSRACVAHVAAQYLGHVRILRLAADGDGRAGHPWPHRPLPSAAARRGGHGPREPGPRLVAAGETPQRQGNPAPQGK
jgi:D-alanyl-D-alanine-carboxypeptidase/D-alanyl-D-alanine-endopeptidase